MPARFVRQRAGRVGAGGDRVWLWSNLPSRMRAAGARCQKDRRWVLRRCHQTPDRWRTCRNPGRRRVHDAARKARTGRNPKSGETWLSTQVRLPLQIRRGASPAGLGVEAALPRASAGPHPLRDRSIVRTHTDGAIRVAQDVQYCVAGIAEKWLTRFKRWRGWAVGVAPSSSAAHTPRPPLREVRASGADYVSRGKVQRRSAAYNGT